LLFLSLAHCRPQLVVSSSSVSEVTNPEEKKTILNDFQGRSILYQSLPQQPFELIVEVESPVLVLTKPKDRNAKRREKAEKRTASELSSNKESS